MLSDKVCPAVGERQCWDPRSPNTHHQLAKAFQDQNCRANLAPFGQKSRLETYSSSREAQGRPLITLPRRSNVTRHQYARFQSSSSAVRFRL